MLTCSHVSVAYTPQEEPDRTERLLKQPWRVLYTRSADCQESMVLSLFAKAKGSSFLGQCFVWFSLAMQVVLGVLAGMASYFSEHGWAGNAQVVAIAVVKLCWAAVLLIFVPCSCKLTNMVRTGCPLPFE